MIRIVLGLLCFRIILSAALTSSIESGRIYATRFLLILARIDLSGFHKWGIEALVTQLYDSCAAVSLAASQVLEEAAYKEVKHSIFHRFKNLAVMAILISLKRVSHCTELCICKMNKIIYLSNYVKY